ncbi:hypothetical protein CHARACLAT_003443 [Characodon lateralis]|uniref:Uncharacterized protein n=1 Tax=Characodon lateralis TaxID=208331 RepID=A0ABU7E9M1_9TELE|nr:hypothetical protein [Characodon lateralis]
MKFGETLNFSRPAFCLSLSPPWVSIPNMVILGLLYRRPLPYPFFSSCWLFSVDRQPGGTGRKGKTGREAKRIEERTDDERKRRRAVPFQLCFWSKQSRENFFTLKYFPLHGKGTNTFTQD